MKKHFFFKLCRKISKPYEKVYTERFVNYFDEEANNIVYDKISDALENKTGLMVSKFGTIELNCLNCFFQKEKLPFLENFKNGLRGTYEFYMDDALSNLCKNSGFFPNKIDLVKVYCEKTIDDAKEIDILGSYLEGEEFINHILCKDWLTINLDGYCAPFKWKKPWSRIMKGKKVLVIHPFAKSIKEQYIKNRELLFDNPDVLPEFSKLTVIQAVQSIAGTKTSYDNWFDALDYMKEQIDRADFDIALIGCGAYGMNLAAHIKRKNKVAIHLAGWTQMLFGVYGKRWIQDQPEFKKYINTNWIRPASDEKPKSAGNVEGGCYW